jgi:hypothetical protein
VVFSHHGAVASRLHPAMGRRPQRQACMVANGRQVRCLAGRQDDGSFP